MIVFDGQEIYGTHGPIITPPPVFQSRRTKFSGVRGISEIRQESGGRSLTVQSWVHNRFVDPALLVAYLELLDVRVGDHGILQVIRIEDGSKPRGGMARVYNDCTFEGFTMAPPGYLPDIAKQLDAINQKTWFAMGTFTFFQLKANHQYLLLGRK